jgi:hypothetical protein
MPPETHTQKEAGDEEDGDTTLEYTHDVSDELDSGPDDVAALANSRNEHPRHFRRTANRALGLGTVSDSYKE